MTLVRLNGSVTPLRLTTASIASSTVVKRRAHSGQDRRRRIAWPSSTSRESMTRESGCRQNGHRIPSDLLPRRLPASPLWTVLGMSCGPPVDQRPQPVDDLHQCNYQM